MDNNNSDLKPEWDESTVLSKNISENKGHIESVIEMLDNGATLPFIARYRKQATGDMPVDKLREVVVQLDELRYGSWTVLVSKCSLTFANFVQ